MTVDAIVLAGGASSRFGADKLAADLDGRPVLAYAAAAARDVAQRVVLVLGPDDPLPAIEGLLIARDPVAHAGPLAGLVTGLEALSADGPVLVLAGDMPRVVPAVLALLLAELAATDAAAVHLDGEPVQTLPLAVRPGRVLPVARELLAGQRRSLRGLLEAVPSFALPSADWRRIDPGGLTLRDVDTPKDLREA